MLPPIGDTNSAEIQFLTQLNEAGLEEALNLISKNDVMYHKCLSVIMNGENIVNTHDKAIRAHDIIK